jgi:hypothetical protein
LASYQWRERLQMRMDEVRSSQPLARVEVMTMRASYNRLIQVYAFMMAIVLLGLAAWGTVYLK